jgi:mxaA protein
MQSLRTSISKLAVPWLASVLAVAPAQAQAQAQSEPPSVRLSVIEPRAFGYQVGDIATREVTIELPRDWRLDEDSLPALGRHGPALELRSLRREDESTAAGTRLRLRLEYQVFAAPAAARIYELPALRLRAVGAQSEEERYVEAWPIAVAPLLPEQAAPRRGLGELQPDTAPVPRDTRTERLVLAACAVATLGLGAWLAFVYVGLPWWSRRHRPFTRVYRRLRAGRKLPASVQEWQNACRALHGAFNETAGQTVFADTLDSFFSRAPRFAPLREEVRAFFARSQAAFFQSEGPVPDAATPVDRDWLLAFARACRNAERGTA